MLAIDYVPDVIVVEVEPEPAADENVMQIRLHAEDRWHRHAVGNRKTACGRDITPSPAVHWMMGFEVRTPEYKGELCTDGCFSPFELELARVANAKGDE